MNRWGPMFVAALVTWGLWWLDRHTSWGIYPLLVVTWTGVACMAGHPHPPPPNCPHVKK